MRIVLTILIIFAVFSAIRIIKGPTVWDRLLGLNMVSAKLIMSLVILAMIRDQAMILDIAILYALLGFVGITFMAIFIQRKGRY